jgi:hypothetical protein
MGNGRSRRSRRRGEYTERGRRRRRRQKRGRKMRVSCHTCSLPLCSISPLEATDWATLLGRGEDDVSRMMDLLYG